ncbi:uridine monophosphate kinase [Candidatus Peregrinibacteria bacterium]|nr:MAG: uridine monophosphate kinase [Candidatus Peregrinibacteria bacterium]
MTRYLLKISGEMLGETGFSSDKVSLLVEEIVLAKKVAGAEIAVVVGGGNIWRGRDSKAFGFSPAKSDRIGMGATVLNAAVLKEMFHSKNILADVFVPHAVPLLGKSHCIEDEIQSLKAGNIVLFAGGTGSPFFTTDSAAIVRALEIQADAVLKGTKVDGVYDEDPEKNPSAKRFDTLSYNDAIQMGLKVMDGTAFSLAREYKMPLFVFDAFQKGAISEAVQGRGRGTWVRTER